MDNLNLNNTFGCTALEPLYGGLNSNATIPNYSFSPMSEGFYGYGYSVPMTPLYIPCGTGVGGPKVPITLSNFEFEKVPYNNEMYLPVDNAMYTSPDQTFYGLESKSQHNGTEPEEQCVQPPSPSLLDVAKPAKTSGDDQSLYGEVSTCATTPTLAALPTGEIPEVFDLDNFGTLVNNKESGLDTSNRTFTPYSQLYPINAQPFSQFNGLSMYGTCVYGLDGMPIYQGYYQQPQEPMEQAAHGQMNTTRFEDATNLNSCYEYNYNNVNGGGYGNGNDNYLQCKSNVQAWQIPDNMASEEASIIEIATEITNNVQYLPAKDMNGKYSLDKNHPIHCVWRDLNRGHCSWRCRWWEDGRRLSKNFNVKRFGDLEAMRMAITMKIRNSTPVERLQLLKEQREAVRNHLELLRQSSLVDDDDDTNKHLVLPSFIGEEENCNAYTDRNNNGLVYGLSSPSSSLSSSASTSFMNKRQAKTLSNTKRIQRENWQRLSWTYVKVPDRSMDQTSVICRLCAKTTRCSRSRNLQQAHIMHLLRMHKNPWKQYIQVAGLTKMCRAAIEALYEQQGYDKHSQWKLRPGTRRPDPYFI